MSCINGTHRFSYIKLCSRVASYPPIFASFSYSTLVHAAEIMLEQMCQSVHNVWLIISSFFLLTLCSFFGNVVYSREIPFKVLIGLQGINSADLSFFMLAKKLLKISLKRKTEFVIGESEFAAWTCNQRMKNGIYDIFIKDKEL